MKKITGFSLIEVLVVMMLGMSISIILVQFLINNGFTVMMNEASFQAQENGRNAVYLLTRDVRMAGYRKNISKIKFSPFYMGKCDINNQCTFDGGLSINDQVSIQYDPVDDKGCDGTGVISDEIIANTYFIKADSGVNALFCQSFNPDDGSKIGSEVALIHGIDILQVQYASSIETSAGKHVEQYLNATNISDWDLITNIKISILASPSSVNNTLLKMTNKTFNLLNSGVQLFSAGVPRFIYTTTINLNNAGI